MAENRPPLFGTLLDSRPERKRSPGALATAIVLHVVLFVLLVIVSKPYVPELAKKLFQTTVVIPIEEHQIAIAPSTTSQGRRFANKKDAKPNVTDNGGAPLTVTPVTPINGIPEPTAGPETVEPGDNGNGKGGSLTEKLNPGKFDARLDPKSTYLPYRIDPADAVRERIAQSIQQFNDSIAAEAEARRRGTDWTITTKDGKKWGIEPGKIHLGSITLPLPVAFNTPPGRRDEANARASRWADIEYQANKEIGRQSFNDRVKAIRARKEKEREEAAKKKTGENAPITN